LTSAASAQDVADRAASSLMNDLSSILQSSVQRYLTNVGKVSVQDNKMPPKAINAVLRALNKNMTGFCIIFIIFARI
jgi:hypothetical protein